MQRRLAVPRDHDFFVGCNDANVDVAPFGVDAHVGSVIGGAIDFDPQPFKPLANVLPNLLGVLADAVAKAMSPPEFREQFFKVVGSEALFNTPEQMLEVAKKEAALIDRIVRTAHIELE